MYCPEATCISDVAIKDRFHMGCVIQVLHSRKVVHGCLECQFVDLQRPRSLAFGENYPFDGYKHTFMDLGSVGTNGYFEICMVGNGVWSALPKNNRSRDDGKDLRKILVPTDTVPKPPIPSQPPETLLSSSLLPSTLAVAYVGARSTVSGAAETRSGNSDPRGCPLRMKRRLETSKKRPSLEIRARAPRLESKTAKEIFL